MFAVDLSFIIIHYDPELKLHNLQLFQLGYNTIGFPRS